MLLHLTKVSFLLVLVTAEVLLTGTHAHERDDHTSSTAQHWWQKSLAFLLRSNF
jgi:hypothetical protein